MDPKDDEQDDRPTPIPEGDREWPATAWRESAQGCFVEPDHGDD